MWVSLLLSSLFLATFEQRSPGNLESHEMPARVFGFVKKAYKLAQRRREEKLAPINSQLVLVSISASLHIKTGKL